MSLVVGGLLFFRAGVAWYENEDRQDRYRNPYGQSIYEYDVDDWNPPDPGSLKPIEARYKPPPIDMQVDQGVLTRITLPTIELQVNDNNEVEPLVAVEPNTKPKQTN